MGCCLWTFCTPLLSLSGSCSHTLCTRVLLYFLTASSRTSYDLLIPQACTVQKYQRRQSFIVNHLLWRCVSKAIVFPWSKPRDWVSLGPSIGESGSIGFLLPRESLPLACGLGQYNGKIFHKWHSEWKSPATWFFKLLMFDIWPVTVHLCVELIPGFSNIVSCISYVWPHRPL